MPTSLPARTDSLLSRDDGPIRLRVGDHVTRDGSDVHEVVDVTDDCYSGTFRCLVAPSGGWCKVGDEEYNLCRRYEVIPLDAEFTREP